MTHIYVKDRKIYISLMMLNYIHDEFGVTQPVVVTPDIRGVGISPYLPLQYLHFIKPFKLVWQNGDVKESENIMFFVDDLLTKQFWVADVPDISEIAMKMGPFKSDFEALLASDVKIEFGAVIKKAERAILFGLEQYDVNERPLRIDSIPSGFLSDLAETGSGMIEGTSFLRIIPI